MAAPDPDRRVAVTGLGCVSALGQGVEASWARLMAGQGAIRTLSRRVADDPGLAFEGPAAPVEALDPAPLMARFGPRPLANLDPQAAFALVATHEALTHAGLIGDGAPDHPALGEAAVLYGSGSGGNATVEEGYHRLFARRTGSVHPQTVPRQMLSAPVGHISMSYGVRGPAFALASACASASHALGEAMHRIRAGRSEVVIAGGTEAALTYGSWSAWAALRAMAPDTCRPFSRERRGMVLGEGAATLVLESAAHAQARGARVLGWIDGEGASSDAHHLTAPNGEGAAAALRRALADARLDPAPGVLVSAHGTGTPLNDKAEAGALRAVLGGALDASLVIATKSAHGHLIGAGGALELLIGLLAMERGMAPPVLNWLGSDPECDVPLPLAPQSIGYAALVSSSFAFGGLNSVLVARRAGAASG